MAQIIQFPREFAARAGKERSKRLLGSLNSSELGLVNARKNLKKSAELLFFTGVRYERYTSLPSERLLPNYGK